MPSEREALAALIEALKEALRDRADVDLAMLFGSRARGRTHQGSDVDVAVEAPGVDLWTLAADLSQAVGLEVDVVDLRGAGYPLLKAVLRDGIPVHQGAAGWTNRRVNGPSRRTRPLATQLRATPPARQRFGESTRRARYST